MKIVIAVAVVLCVFVTDALPATIDGILDPGYGPARSTQTTQTSLGDTDGNSFPGSELDIAFGFVADGALHLFLGGNTRRYFGEPLIAPDYLVLFIDCAPGGQNPLRADNPSVGNYLDLQDLTGWSFDPEFVPDYALVGAHEASSPPAFFAYYAELPSLGGGAGYLLGRSDPGVGTLSGGTNPFVILASLDLGNVGGVDGGCAAADGSGVTMGMEWAIPLAAIGNPSGLIRVCAALVRQHDGISNQVLGPIPPGTCSLGAPSGVDFAAIPGPQYFTIDLQVSAARNSWGGLKTLYR